jgi:hypothetical protein
VLRVVEVVCDSRVFIGSSKVLACSESSLFRESISTVRVLGLTALKEALARTVSTFRFSRFWGVLGFGRGCGSDGSLGRASVRADGL